MNQLVLVGGCAAGLLITDPAQAAIRATNDVDLIVETLSLAGYYEICSQLRAKGFQDEPDVICRWNHQGVKLDLMPTDSSILGFSNYWYPEALRSATRISLPSGRSTRMVTAPVFIATKLVAFQNRGKGDYQASHDIEDIIAVVDGRVELISEFMSATDEVREYLDDEIGTLLGTRAFFEAIYAHLKPDAASQKRHDLIVSRLRILAGM
jgi:predicted nucleotidyltransferase